MNETQRNEMEALRQQLEKRMRNAGFYQVKAEVKEDSRGECIAKIHLKEDHISPSAIQAYGTRLLNDYPIKALVLNGIPFPKESSIAEWI